MNTKACRMMSAFVSVLLVISILSTQAYATGSEEINRMGENIMSWYRLIRDHIAVPLMIISFASCGFKILGSGFNGAGDKAIGEAKQQFITTAIALIVLMVLPYLIGSAREMLETTGWKPPTSSIILPLFNFL